MSAPAVPPETRIVYARLRSFSEREGRLRLVFADPSGRTEIFWVDLGDPKPGAGQRVAVTVDDRGKPLSWAPA
jgi:hypothetical protein